VEFSPGPPDAGLVFVRRDLEGAPRIPVCPAAARYDSKEGRRTILQDGDAQVHTVEHILAAVAGLGIDSLEISLDGLEAPEPDGGGALPIAQLLQGAGIVDLDVPCMEYRLARTVAYRDGDVEIQGVPSDETRLSYTIVYDDPLIGTQHYSFTLSPERFMSEIAPARTFALYRDVEMLRAAGMIKGGSLDNAVVVDDGKLMNDEPLRFPDEFARHKILDLLGDLAILGRPLRGHIMAVRGGHESHVAFVKRTAKALEDAAKPSSWVREPLTAHNKPEPHDPEKEGFVFNIQDILRVMPHRYPFLLVDRILEMSRDRVVGIKNVTINEPFFQGHFPGQPVMPGVLLIEAMAQVGGVLLLNAVEDPEGKLVYFIGIDKARFRQAVVPGDQLRFVLQMDRLKGRICKMSGKAYVDDALVCQAELMSSVVEPWWVRRGRRADGTSPHCGNRFRGGHRRRRHRGAIQCHRAEGENRRRNRGRPACPHRGEHLHR